MSLAPDYTDEAEEIVRVVRYAQGIDALLIQHVSLALRGAFAAGGRKALDLVFELPAQRNTQ